MVLLKPLWYAWKTNDAAGAHVQSGEVRMGQGPEVVGERVNA